MPEMRLFWYFVLFFAIFWAVNFLVNFEIIYLSMPLIFINSGLLMFFLIFAFSHSIKLAGKNLEIKTDKAAFVNILSVLPSGIVVYDRNLKILLFNKTAESIFGISVDDVVGQRFSPDRVSQSRYQLLSQVLFPSLAPTVVKYSDAGGYPQTMDLSFENPNIELRIITDKFIDANGDAVGFIKIISDRTREKEMLRSKSEFISVAAHQLRTPLSGLNWAMESLAKEAISEAQKEIIDTALKATAYLLKIVNDLLDVSKIEEGRFGYNFEEVNMADFIETVIGETKELSEESGIKINFQKPESDIKATIDPQKLGMVLFNLLDNAVRYNVKNGEVFVDLDKLKDKPYIRISVKDTGIGIAEQEKEKLFTKFFRADNAIKAAPNGSGLGLYIVKNIIKRHGGEAWFESEINRGSTFYFTLPIDSKLIPVKEIAYDE
ncbi:MAG: ATP-binding protein [Patescibacteria group bacterium]